MSNRKSEDSVKEIKYLGKSRRKTDKIKRNPHYVKRVRLKSK